MKKIIALILISFSLQSQTLIKLKQLENAMAGSVITTTGTGTPTWTNTLPIGAIPTLTNYLTVLNPLYTGSLAIGALTYTDTGILAAFQSSVNGYNQLIVQNTSNAANASANVIVSNNLGTASNNFGEIGMNSSAFTGTSIFSQPNDVYVTATGGNLDIGTNTANSINIAANGSSVAAITVNSNNSVVINNTTTIGTGTVVPNVGTLGSVRLKQGNSFIDFGERSTNNPAIWFGNANNANSNTTSNWAVSGGTISTIVNGPVTIDNRINAANVFVMRGTTSGSATVHFDLVGLATTSATAGANIPTFKFTPGGRQYATGAITLLEDNQWNANTISSVGASVLTDYVANIFRKGNAGTNMTFTRNWGLGTDGSAFITQSLVVGSGVKTPLAILDVTGTAAVSSSISAGGNIITTAAAPFIQIHASTAADLATKFALTNSSSGSLTTDGTIMGLANGVDFYFLNQEATGRDIWKVNSKDIFILKPDGGVFLGGANAGVSGAGSNIRIEAGGQVGINMGASVPTASLQVTGDFSVSTNGSFGGSIFSSSKTAGIGYSVGSGSTVTQATSRTTGVTINAVTGAITLVSAAGSTTWQSFTVTNSAVAITDVIIINQVSGTDLNQIFITNVAAGSFRVSFATTGGVTVEQPVFGFAVIKGRTN